MDSLNIDWFSWLIANGANRSANVLGNLDEHPGPGLINSYTSITSAEKSGTSGLRQHGVFY
jgi:hypothetical protein